jgi:prepilin peptidase CpaA
VAVGYGWPIPTRHLGVTSARERAIQTAILIVSIGILAVIAFGDVRTRRIPNALSLAVATLGLIRIILVHDLVAAGHTLVAGAAIFAATFLLFRRGSIGGGDAKLLTAMALLLDPRDLFSFLFLMSLCGGALALAILVRDRLGLRWRRLSPLATMPPAKTIAQARSTVPYGVAIAASGAITLILEASVTR